MPQSRPPQPAPRAHSQPPKLAAAAPPALFSIVCEYVLGRKVASPTEHAITIGTSAGSRLVVGRVHQPGFFESVLGAGSEHLKLVSDSHVEARVPEGKPGWLEVTNLSSNAIVVGGRQLSRTSRLVVQAPTSIGFVCAEPREAGSSVFLQLRLDLPRGGSPAVKQPPQLERVQSPTQMQRAASVMVAPPHEQLPPSRALVQTLQHEYQLQPAAVSVLDGAGVALRSGCTASSTGSTAPPSGSTTPASTCQAHPQRHCLQAIPAQVHVAGFSRLEGPGASHGLHVEAPVVLSQPDADSEAPGVNSVSTLDSEALGVTRVCARLPEGVSDFDTVKCRPGVFAEFVGQGEGPSGGRKSVDEQGHDENREFKECLRRVLDDESAGSGGLDSSAVDELREALATSAESQESTLRSVKEWAGQLFGKLDSTGGDDSSADPLCASSPGGALGSPVRRPAPDMHAVVRLLDLLQRLTAETEERTDEVSRLQALIGDMDLQHAESELDRSKRGPAGGRQTVPGADARGAGGRRRRRFWLSWRPWRRMRWPRCGGSKGARCQGHTVQ